MRSADMKLSAAHNAHSSSHSAGIKEQDAAGGSGGDVEEREETTTTTTRRRDVEFTEDTELKTDGSSGKKLFPCSFCGRMFARRQTLEQHERIHTGERPFHCSTCSKSFRQRSALLVHAKAHVGDKAFECFVCLKRFYRPGELKAHLGIHTGVRQHNCSLCSKGFGRPSDLKRHMQTHKADTKSSSSLLQQPELNKSPLECPQCGKKFTRRSQVLVHQRVHTGEKPYHCARCGESFRWRQNYKTHQRNNICEKPHRCPDCDKSFTGLSALEKHKVLVHSGVIVHSSQCQHGSHGDESRHQCCVCGKNFSQAKVLLDHLRIHTGEKPFSCSLCDKSFRQVAHLREHQRVHSGEKPFQCPVCHKRFSYSQTMKKHLWLLHGVLQGNMEEKSQMEGVEEVKIVSAPSSPTSRLSDEPSEEPSQLIKTEEEHLPMVDGEQVDLVPKAELSEHSDFTGECLHDGNGKQDDGTLMSDVKQVKLSLSPRPASEPSEEPGSSDKKKIDIKTESYDASTLSNPTSEISKYPVYDELAVQIKSEEKCFSIMDDAVSVKVESAPVGAL